MDTPDPEPAPESVSEPVPVPVPAQPEPEPVPQTPQTGLTFLLVEGRRRTMAFDPETTVGRVKELVWSAWPAEPEWQDDRPPAPAYLRILYLGKILQDEDTLAKLAFPAHTPGEPTPPPPTIVHLSVRSHAPPPDDTPKKRKSMRRRDTATDAAGGPASDANDDDAGGCCCIVC
ncbi:hypothetical protein C8R44DRAFT_618182 [Mycena epipterygia]|nr:hypothetical protein C8R44DRAFT_618182 [Mycena epipterygia]